MHGSTRPCLVVSACGKNCQSESTRSGWKFQPPSRTRGRPVSMGKSKEPALVPKVPAIPQNPAYRLVRSHAGNLAKEIPRGETDVLCPEVAGVEVGEPGAW